MSKAITAIFAVLAIAIVNMLTMEEAAITYAALVICSALGGVAIWRNGGVKS